ncbi:VanZ family protein [Microbacterium istanbulense]|uniref:VanZ family protein n=1 Tax=Microbacterium istanbulense TaxID=3122049 RepID=A0ABU8LFE5_9MICO
MSTDSPPRRSLALPVALVLGIPYLIGLLLLTIWPRPVQDSAPVILDLVVRAVHRGLGWTWLGFSELEAIANVLVFVPIGTLAFLAFRRVAWPLAFAAGPLLSLGVELVQKAALPHRIGSVADIVLNSVGATLGVLLAWAIAAAVSQLRPSKLEAS